MNLVICNTHLKLNNVIGVLILVRGEYKNPINSEEILIHIKEYLSPNFDYNTICFLCLCLTKNRPDSSFLKAFSDGLWDFS